MFDISITYDGAVGPHSKRVMDRALKTMYQLVGLTWVHDLLPKHFTHAGAREYAYALRRGEEPGISGKKLWRSYTRKKQRKYGHTLPLVWTGQTRIQSRAARIRASTQTVRITVPADRLRRNPKSRTNPPEEIVRVSPAEVELLTKLADRSLQQSLDADRSHRRRKLT